MVLRCLLAIVAVLSMSAGVFGQGAQTKNMRIAGVNRSYIIYVPSGINKPPLLFTLHGYNQDAAWAHSATKMDNVAEREKFIVVYPDAINRSWDMSGPNDYNFLMAIIDTVDNKYGIDRERIYSCGFSQGGFMTFQLGCRYSDIFAAIAPTSGHLNGDCNLSRPMSMRLTFGTNEGFSGGTAAFMDDVKKWIKNCNCPETPVVTRPYPEGKNNSYVTRLYYGPCDQGTVVIADSIRTGGHEWPMNTNDRINNSEETWAFLKNFTLKNSTSVLRQPLSGIHTTLCASYASGVIHLKGADEKSRVRVIDTKGRTVSSATVSKQAFTFSNKPSGIYMVMVNGKSGFAAHKVIVP